jgi:hypothetical protein
MNNPLKSDTAKQGKNLAKQIAKQVVKEPFEIGKTAFEQVIGTDNQNESSTQKTSDVGGQNETMEKREEELLKEKDKVRGQRILQALENEIREITENKKNEKEKKEYLEKQEELLEKEETKPLVIPVSKKPRNILAGMGKKPKTDSSLQAERQQKRVERIMPPTG